MPVALLAFVLLANGGSQDMAVTRFRLVQVEPQLGGYAEDRLAQRLTERGFRVTTPSDLDTVLGLERQRQLLGCTEDTACMAEISAALGVSLVAAGRVSRLGTHFEIDIRVLNLKAGRVIATASRGVDDESRLGSAVDDCAQHLAAQLSPPRPFPWRLVGPLAAGALSLAAGGIALGAVELQYQALTNPSAMPGLVLRDAEISDLYAQLSSSRAVGFGLMGLGVALVATGLLWNAVVPDEPVTVAFTTSPTGAAVVAEWSF
jgi:hypothetical protein